MLGGGSKAALPIPETRGSQGEVIELSDSEPGGYTMPLSPGEPKEQTVVSQLTSLSSVSEIEGEMGLV
jgi:hypothetical protein